MIPTPIGAIVILVGMWLLFRPAAEMLVFVLFCSLFAGASALDAVALGHSSIPPNMVALGFLALRLCRKDFRKSGEISSGLWSNAWLIVYCVYGAASALILPRIFAGRVMVMSMQHAKVLSTLQPSSQNITQALYLLGTGVAAVAAGAAVQKPRAAWLLVRALVVITWIHILTGIADAAASAVHINGLFNFVRNGAYGQLDQTVADYHRIAGMTPEPSAYAALGVTFTAFLVELWYRGIAVWRTGVTAAVMAIVLLLSTSSTAYLFLTAYLVVLLVRSIVFPRALGVQKTLALACVFSASALCGIAFVLMSPAASRQVTDVLLAMTVTKSTSSSGLERAMWAKQGWDLFLQTRGLGVGVGSFRSSNFFTAVLGSVGPSGIVLLFFYLLQVIKLGRYSTYGPSASRSVAIGAAAAWVPVLGLVPGAFGAPSADPGLLFGLFCGVALALRSRAYTAIDNMPLPRQEPFESQASLLSEGAR